jgi:hemerythrin
MALMNWSDEFSVNIAKIDQQHKKFFDLINNLHDAMRAGNGKEALGTTLKALVDYTKVHFTDEERLLQLYHYPELDKHKAIHDAFVKQTMELQTKFESGNTMLSIQVMGALKDWLINHINGTDKQYTGYLNSKGVK